MIGILRWVWFVWSNIWGIAGVAFVLVMAWLFFRASIEVRREDEYFNQAAKSFEKYRGVERNRWKYGGS